MRDEDDVPNTGNGEALRMTTQIVASFAGNNKLSTEELVDLIRSVHRAVASLGDGTAERALERPKPAAPIAKSVHTDYIICLEDGKKFKSLKRHLRTQYDMTPEKYREKWGLPSDYPMVAPNYAAARSQLAKQMGLGQQRCGRR